MFLVKLFDHNLTGTVKITLFRVGQTAAWAECCPEWGSVPPAEACSESQN